jgi:hypothetical protein
MCHNTRTSSIESRMGKQEFQTGQNTIDLGRLDDDHEAEVK